MAKIKKIGWDNLSLKEMLEKSEQEFSETHHYCGITELKLKENDPLRYERVFSKLKATMVSSREVALHISASPVVREVGELCFSLYTPEGDSLVLSTGIIVHVHTMSDAIKFMIRNDYETKVGIKDKDIFCNNDVDIGDVHTADVQTLVPIFFEGELVGWAGGVTHEVEIGSIDPASVPVTPINRYGDGLYICAEKIGENDEVRRDYQIRCERNLRHTTYWTLDEKTRIAGCHIIRDMVVTLIKQEGIDYYKVFCREVIEEGRQSFMERVKERLFPGKYRSAAFFDVPFKGKPIASIAAKDTLMHAPMTVSVDNEGNLGVSLDGANKWGYFPYNCPISAMQGGFWVLITQMLAYDGKVNDGSYFATKQFYPPGSWSNPQNLQSSTASSWLFLMPAFTNLDRSLSRALFARGFREEIKVGYGCTDGMQCGGIGQYGQPFSMINFEVAASGMGARGIMDGLDCAYAMWNPESDAGDVEVWETAHPLIYIGRRITSGSGGAGKYRGGNGYHSVWMVWNTNELEIYNLGAGKVFDNAGIFGGYPGATGYHIFANNTNMKELIEKKSELPHAELDPNNSDILRLVKGDITVIDEGALFPAPFKEYDIYANFYYAGPGYGDPIERDPKLVENDLNNDMTLLRIGELVYGVAGVKNNGKFIIDLGKTKKLRKTIKEKRRSNSIPTKDWMKAEREKIINKELPEVVRDMYRESMELSSEWSKEFIEFWDLPDEFSF
jgi:N-methylhydantoinase B/oxoprolinase/acetone carboxylase alpha subunit